jgi:NAD(P)-dependent dehydrogenase (short-subunit alcohol dehydrogenase family)
LGNSTLLSLLLQIAVITGGDSGIGRAVALAYAREGAHVAISYLPEEETDAEVPFAETFDLLCMPSHFWSRALRQRVCSHSVHPHKCFWACRKPFVSVKKLACRP